MRFGNSLFLLPAVILAQAVLLPDAIADVSERRVYSLITVKDYWQAVGEAGSLIERQPDSVSAWKAYLAALAKAGEEKKLIAAYQNFRSRFPDEKDQRILIEQVAWCIIEKGGNSSSPHVRLCALLGAYMGQDAKSVPLILNALRDSNPQIRAVAVKLSSNFRDAPIQDEVLRLLSSEKSSLVRQEVIRAIGNMKIKAATGKVVAILSSDKSIDEEKASAIEALVGLMESVERRELERLVLSDRAGLRELACRAAAHTFDSKNLDLIYPLLQDHCSDVRAAAIQTIGLLKRAPAEREEAIALLEPLLKDPDPYVAISSAWGLTLSDYPPGLKAFEKWVLHPNFNYSHIAAGALAKTGSHGVSLMGELLGKSKDPYVRANLALGLLSQRVQAAEAAKTISHFLSEVSDRIMFATQGSIRYLTKSRVKFTPLIPGQPELVDHTARLELLNLLAIMEDPLAPVAARNFLQKRVWGVSGLAAALLLTEGDEEAIEIVEANLVDPDRKIKVQAAWILALWGRGENAIGVLQESYRDADREMKERILEAIGQIGSENSIPFLADALNEPSQSLRIIAAASLLKCLYH